MKRLQQITKDISELTARIEQDYPELYQYLDENPITLPTMKHPVMDVKVMSEYLESLKNLLENHIKSHKK